MTRKRHIGADDCISSLASQRRQDRIEVFIVSVDDHLELG
jgi:hypothetical protein